MAIRIGSVIRAIKGTGRPQPGLNRTLKVAFGEEATPAEFIKPKFWEKIEGQDHIYDHLSSIETSLADENIAKRLNKAKLRTIFTGDEQSIKDTYSFVEGLKLSNNMTSVFQDIGGIPGNRRHIKRFFKEKLRGAEDQYKNVFPIMEKNFRSYVLSNVDRSLRTSAGQAFDLIHTNIRKFESLYGVKQDDVVRSLLGEDVDSVINNPVLTALADGYRKFDESVIGFAQDLGVPIGDLEDFVLPFSIPKKAIYGVNMKELLTQHTDLEEPAINHIVKKLLQQADETTTGTGFNFFSRSVKFLSAQDEIAFYRAVNNIDPEQSLLSLMLQHKQRLVKKASLIAQFGLDPVRNSNRAIDKLAKGLDAKGTKELEKVRRDVELLMSAYDGSLNVTAEWVDRLGQGISTMTSIATGASGLSLVRNLFLDFNMSLASAGRAVYNPKYGVGSTAFGIVRDFSYLVGRGARLNNQTKKAVLEVLDAMEFAAVSDGYNRAGLLAFEDIFDTDVTQGMLGRLRRYNNSLHSWTGNHSLLDFRRYRELTSMNQLWTTNLKNFSYDEWVNSMDNIGKEQLKYLDKVHGIGRNEFEALREVKPKTIVKKHKLITRDGILEIPEDIANKFKRNNETAEQLKIRLANSWQKLMYISTAEATPVVRGVDSVSRFTKGTDSWTRFLLTPIFKFGDIASSQAIGVHDRVLMTMFGKDPTIPRQMLSYLKVGSYYMGAGVGIAWMHDLLKGRTPTDFTNPNNLYKTILGSGFLGFPAMIMSMLTDPYKGAKRFGVVGALPVSAPAHKISNTVRSSIKNPQEALYHGVKTATDLTGLSNMWYNRGLVDEMFKKMLLSPEDERFMELRYKRAIEQRNKRQKERFGL